jgi:colanic acid/amylovoran biosynthesis glycosyltransferase
LEKVAFLYATFPRSTETFVRRELKALWNRGLEACAYSLWGGDKKWNGIKIELFHKYKLVTLFFWIPYWAFLRPLSFSRILRYLWGTKCPNIQNFNETFLGLGFALVEARAFERKGYDLIHAVWATMPATAALAIHRLTGIPFSMGAHAYDLFRKGGDWLLEEKIRSACFVRTSSLSSAKRLEQRGVDSQRIKLIRRGLENFSNRDFSVLSKKPEELKLIAVGRLVPKKGYFHMLQIVFELSKRKIPFSLQIIGGGKLRKRISTEIKRFGLEKNVTLQGAFKENQVRELLLTQDVMLFTGIIDSQGDRDGIPNVIPEAMDAGCLVLSSVYAGASEAFIDGVSGFSLHPRSPGEWVKKLEEFYQDPDSFTDVRRNAVKHVRANFDIQKTASLLHHSIQKAVEGDPN